MNQPIFAIAITGPPENPYCVLVQLLRQATLPGTFLCLAFDGTEFIVNQSRLILQWQAQPKTSPPYDTTKSTIQTP